jgi:hypothetical protein
MVYQEWGSGPPHFDGKNYQMWSKRMAAFLHGKGQILWDVTVDTIYVQSMNFLAPGSRDMINANNKVVEYLFRALCQCEFDRVHTENLACRIWSVLKESHIGNAQVQGRKYATYRREYENFTHLPGETINALFQRFTMVVNNMRANVDVLSYNDHDKVVKLLHSLDRMVWGGKFEAIVESEKYDTVVWTSLVPLHRWVPGPTTRWAPGTTRLALHGTWRRGAQGLRRSSTRLGLCTRSALYRGLLDVLD